MEEETTLISPVEWERRKQFVGFTEEDAQMLEGLRPTLETHVDEAVSKLYEQFLQFDEPTTIFPDEVTSNRIRTLQKESFMRLTSGDYGGGYLKGRLSLHEQIGLSPRWYQGAYSIYVQVVMPHVLKSGSRKSQRALMALLKLTNLDLELATTAYVSAREQTIMQQSVEILELSTPVVQVWDGVVVAPLIGTLDSSRTQQLMERLLETIVNTVSRVALIDITGVQAIDTATAQHLIETVNAVRLLGADAILTGVKPAIAQSLVHLGVELENITTRPSLAAGLRVALESLGIGVNA